MYKAHGSIITLKRKLKGGAFHSKTTHAEHQPISEFPENLQVEVAQTPGSRCKVKTLFLER